MAKNKNLREASDLRKAGMSRRDFARRAALAVASVAVLPKSLASQSETPTPAHPAPQQPAEQPKLSPESRAEVEAKFGSILHRHGQRLSEEQKADVRRLLTESQKSLEALRAFPLDNADEPATVLKLYPERGPSEQRPSPPPGQVRDGKKGSAP
jgi:hypothetical protein